jgi:hypothetical protein
MSENEEIDILEEKEIIEKPIKKALKKAFENPSPKVIIKKKIVVKVATPPESESEKEEEEEEKPKDKPKPVKVKRERTQKQIDAFNRCILKKKERASERQENAKKLLAIEKEALEEKIVKKAISIKKKQIKKQSALDEVSDDDTEIEVIREKAKKITTVPVIHKPCFNFI